MMSESERVTGGELVRCSRLTVDCMGAVNLDISHGAARKKERMNVLGRKTTMW